MNILEPYAELWKQETELHHIAKCARVCYKKETGDDKKLINFLTSHNHLSMLRHASYYYCVPERKAPLWLRTLHSSILFADCKIVGIDVAYDKDCYWAVINGQWAWEHPRHISSITHYKVSENTFRESKSDDVKNLIRYTFKIITQISTSRELNRVSPNNIAEQSTRYVYEDGSIVRPHWITKENAELYLIRDTEKMSNKAFLYLKDVEESFQNYQILTSEGLKKEDARGELPLDTATEVVYTYNKNEWNHIIDNRYHDATGKAHPNAKLAIGLVLNTFKIQNS